MLYHTKTYIAADWDHDYDAVEKLYEWNSRKDLKLNFTDAHDLQQARDSSLRCSTKNSLQDRLNASKTFVLIVGDHTKTLTKGRCSECDSCQKTLYGNYPGKRGRSIDQRSYIEFECEQAVKSFQNGEIKKLVILYNSSKVEKWKCPDCIKHEKFTHVAMKKSGEWDYPAVRDALMKKQN